MMITTPPESRHALLRLLASITVSALAAVAYATFTKRIELPWYVPPPLTVGVLGFALVYWLLCRIARLPYYSMADDRTMQALILLGKAAGILALHLVPPFAFREGGIVATLVGVLIYGVGICVINQSYARDRHFGELPTVARDAFLMLVLLAVVCQWTLFLI